MPTPEEILIHESTPLSETLDNARLAVAAELLASGGAAMIPGSSNALVRKLAAQLIPADFRFFPSTQDSTDVFPWPETVTVDLEKGLTVLAKDTVSFVLVPRIEDTGSAKKLVLYYGDQPIKRRLLLLPGNAAPGAASIVVSIPDFLVDGTEGAKRAYKIVATKATASPNEDAYTYDGQPQWRRFPMILAAGAGVQPCWSTASFSIGVPPKRKTDKTPDSDYLSYPMMRIAFTAFPLDEGAGEEFQTDPLVIGGPIRDPKCINMG